MNPKLEYIDSKLDYKTNEVIDLYVLSLRRSPAKARLEALDTAVNDLHDYINKEEIPQ